MKLVRNTRKQWESVVVAAIIASIWLYFHFSWIGVCVIAVGILGCIISKKSLYFFDYLWHGLFQIIGNINAKIILAILFFLVLTPMALISKLFNKKAAVQSAFIRVEKQMEKADFEAMG